ncbi:PREDICTED: uncharacterized protein LOC107186708 [Dufourea novaeangliae]|uniref:uncharacterized protein LOC107186708 n=1 Tax=Dufourea novaeangliae TaxID=178035 RepID=UPI000767C35E|nr:PREDICTED: uncharacterized protein LOC107186708 [Dufourea novaeangliae]
MLQIMVEAFAKSLIEKIMLEAFDVMDTNDEKSRMESCDELANIQTQSMLHIHDHSCMNCNKSETTELIEKMVRGLRNLQIGDLPSIPSFLTNLENQVKHVVQNVDRSISIEEGTKTLEVPITQGQGDVHQIIHNAVIEATPTDSTCIRNETENSDSNDITRVSGSVLHRMIEELETRSEENNVEMETEPDDTISKEVIAVRKETEEKFIRTVESVDDPTRNNIDLPFESNSKNNVCNFVYDGSTPLSLVHSTPFTNNTCSGDVAIKEITASPLPTQKVSLSDITCEENYQTSNTKSEKSRKKGIFSRMRKHLRTVFGRRKN